MLLAISSLTYFLTETCDAYRQINKKLYFQLDQKNEQLDQKNEQLEIQRETIQAFKQKIPRVEKRDIGVQFNFLVPVSGKGSYIPVLQ